MTDAELQQYVKSNGVTYDAFQKQLRDQQTVLDYVRKKKPTVFDIRQARRRTRTSRTSTTRTSPTSS